VVCVCVCVYVCWEWCVCVWVGVCVSVCARVTRSQTLKTLDCIIPFIETTKTNLLVVPLGGWGIWIATDR